MDIETNPETEVAPTNDNTVETVIDQVETETEAQDGDIPEQEDDFEEIDWEDGKRYSVPKTLKPALMKAADYTHKTQTLAEERRALDAFKAEAQRESEAQKADLKSYAELHSIDTQLEQYKKLNWDEITNSDPVQAFKLDREMRELQQTRQLRVQELSQREQERGLKAQQETAKRFQDTVAIVQREIKGWSPEVDRALESYVKSYDKYGIPQEFIKEIGTGKFGAAPILMAHKAYLYDQLVQKQSAQKPQAEVKPVTKIASGKSSPTTPTQFSPTMTDAEYDRWRAKQKKAK